ncbi:MAG: HAD-IIB family hydrolase [Cyanobacteria bacterium SBLK]|nr:HAD-IIB family hydrolase [Cyanobacteria bacterium SBLK]
MTGKIAPLVFTDLDGTLLGSEDYRYDAALPLIHRLKSENIPLIPVTSKTRAEVAELREAIALKDPFIVENGSGIFISLDDPRFPVAGSEIRDNDAILQLGLTYPEVRAQLRRLESRLGVKLQGFGDLSVADIQRLTGLPLEDARRAKQRDFTEPFVTPKNIPGSQIAASVKELGLQVTVGDRFSHLIGAKAGKGEAVRKLVASYQKTIGDRQIFTIGLGNSPNDIPMLEAVDLAIVLPSKNGTHPGLAGRGWQVAPSPAPEGWAEAIRERLDRIRLNHHTFR